MVWGWQVKCMVYGFFLFFSSLIYVSFLTRCLPFSSASSQLFVPAFDWQSFSLGDTK